jgi:hypothetical protein
VALLAVFTMALRFSIGADTYWHLRVGDWILSEGTLPTADPFSLTRLGADWIYPGWLAQIALFAVYQVLGFPGLNLLTALVVSTSFGFVWMAMEGKALLRAFVLLLAATASAVYWSARPHIFTLLFSAVTLWALARFRRDGSRIIWLIPVITVIWANVHGGFIIPILLIVLEIAALLFELLLPRLRIAIGRYGSKVEEGVDTGRAATPSNESEHVESLGAEGSSTVGRQKSALGRLKTLSGVGLASVAAVLINPFGIEMLAYPLRTVSIGVLQDYIQEWQSPNFHQLEVQPFLWLLLLVLASMAISKKRATPIELIHVGVFAYLGFLAARNVPLFTLVAAPVLSRHLDAILAQWLPSRSVDQELSPRLTRPLNVILLVLLALVALIKGTQPLSHQFNEQVIKESMPTEAVDYIQTSQPEGPLLNSYNWGGYVLWRLHPEYLSFVDGRTDLFDDAILEEYLDIWRGTEGWQASLNKWGIKTVLIETDAPLARELLRDGWNIAHKDDQASVFTAPD